MRFSEGKELARGYISADLSKEGAPVITLQLNFEGVVLKDEKINTSKNINLGQSFCQILKQGKILFKSISVEISKGASHKLFKNCGVGSGKNAKYCIVSIVTVKLKNIDIVIQNAANTQHT